MINLFRSFIPSPLFILVMALSFAGPVFAQSVVDDALNQIEAKQEQRREDIERLRELQTTPKTAEEVLEMLKKRAEDRLEEKRRTELLKTRISLGVTTGYESNPANSQDINEKGDAWEENTFSANWIPKFSNALRGDFGYNLSNKFYSEQESLSTDNHSLNTSLKYLPLASGRLTIEPGGKYEWNIYPFDSSSSYEQSKGFLKFNYLLSQLWSYGGKYEYAFKTYDKKAALNDSGTNFNFHRADRRDTAELWVKRQIGKYSIKLKEKGYRNNSNSQFQHYDDYDDLDSEISLSGAFLKDSKLYLIFTTDYEIKNYRKRAADTAVARGDRALQYRLNSYYTINKSWSLSHSFSLKNNNSNKASGEFNDITHSMGLTLNF
jgi:hypothetical protein